ncbi:MAG TPA: hypothetical protein DEQ30_13560, partial [Porphyromonadaceae bacterium]|nr:hypothetical protein [Porphyromonadaceae bacterium]
LSGYLTDDVLSGPAACTIASIGGEAAAKALQMALMRRNARSAEAQRNIIQALGDVTSIAGTEELLKTMLNTDDVTTKSVILKTLGKTGTKSSLPNLAAAAAAAGYKDDLTGATDAYIQLIGRVYEQGDTKEASLAAQNLFKNATKTGAAQMRIAALEIMLAAQADKLKALKTALKDPDISYRNAALRYASGYADKTMYTELFKMLPKAGKEEKINLLNWIGNEAQCPAKRDMLKTVETGVEKTGTQTLVQQMDLSDGDIKQAAAIALAQIGNKDAVPALSGLLQSEDTRIIALAKSVLSSFDGE